MAQVHLWKMCLTTYEALSQTLGMPQRWAPSSRPKSLFLSQQAKTRGMKETMRQYILGDPQLEVCRSRAMCKNWQMRYTNSSNWRSTVSSGRPFQRTPRHSSRHLLSGSAVSSALRRGGGLCAFSISIPGKPFRVALSCTKAPAERMGRHNQCEICLFTRTVGCRI